MEELKIVFLSFTQSGKNTYNNLSKNITNILTENLQKDFVLSKARIDHIHNNEVVNIKNRMNDIWEKYNIIVFISSTGIATRFIAPFIKDKYVDPGVIVLDDMGKYLIPILSGHVGRSNEIALELSKICNAQPIITTASDNRGFRSLDLWMKDNDLFSIDRKKLTLFMTAMVEGKKVYLQNTTTKELTKSDYENMTIISKKDEELISITKEDFLIKIEDYYKVKNHQVNNIGEKDISYNDVSYNYDRNNELTLYNKNLIVGMGCRKGKKVEELLDFLKSVFKEEGLNIESIKEIISIDIKKEEEGLLSLSNKLKVPIRFLSNEKLKEIVIENEEKGTVFNKSEFVNEITGVPSVCESCALYYGGKLLVNKKAHNGMTISVGIIR